MNFERVQSVHSCGLYLNNSGLRRGKDPAFLDTEANRTDTKGQQATLGSLVTLGLMKARW